MQQRPRMKSRPESVAFRQDDAVAVAVRHRLVSAKRGVYRIKHRHGIRACRKHRCATAKWRMRNCEDYARQQRAEMRATRVVSSQAHLVLPEGTTGYPYVSHAREERDPLRANRQGDQVGDPRRTRRRGQQVALHPGDGSRDGCCAKISDSSLWCSAPKAWPSPGQDRARELQRLVWQRSLVQKPGLSRFRNMPLECNHCRP